MQVIASFSIRINNEGKTKLQPLAYFREIKRAGYLKPLLSLGFLSAIKSFTSTINLAIIILVVMVFGSHFSLGTITSVFAIVTIWILLLNRIVTNRKARMFIYITATIIPFIGVFPLFWGITISTIIIFRFAMTPRAMVAIESETERLNLPKYWGGEQFILENNLFFKTCFFLGRIISLTAVVIAGLSHNPEFALVIVLTIVLFAFSLQGLLILRWKQKYRPALPTNTTVDSTTKPVELIQNIQSKY